MAGGGSPGKDLTSPGSPRYQADLTGVAVRLPTDRINLLLRIIETREEHARRDGKVSRFKLSELVRHVFELGMYELQVREAVARWTKRHRTATLREIADHVQLPEDLIRRELAARGVTVPTFEPGEVGWPPADPRNAPRPSDEPPSA